MFLVVRTPRKTVGPVSDSVFRELDWDYSEN